MKAATTLILIFLVCCLVPCDGWARSVTDWRNKHNLSIFGPGLPGVTRAAEGEERVCIFCHTPHHANTSRSNQTPLWSRELSTKTYDLYASSSFQSNPQQPTGSARLCLSCHDGTIALGKLNGGKIIGGLSAPIPAGRASNLGENQDRPDLRNDHPISIMYPQDNAEIVASPADIRLESGMMQCTACHEPHDDQNSYFLVKDNKQPGSPLCVTCHQKNGWANSLHETLNILYPPVPPKWEVQVFACEACHVPHNAQQPQNLLRGQTESLTCLLTCHNGSLPVSQYGLMPIKNGFNQMYKHTAAVTGVVHWADEDTHDQMNSPLYPLQTHVECVDCHNPHSVSTATAAAPYANGFVKGVKVNKLATHDFELSTTEYDVCFKCHADSYEKFSSFMEILPIRQYQILPQFYIKDQFKPGNSTLGSFHPVMDKVDITRVNVVGLKSAYLARNGASVSLKGDGSSIIYCTACHDPHGSNEPHMLVDRYINAQDMSPTSYFSSNYALCYRCHDEMTLLDGASSWFTAHQSHVRNRVIPCYVCHDPHGGVNFKHLVNFDVTPNKYVSPSSPVPVYRATATGGSCTVSCHTTGTPDPFTHSYSHP